MKRDDDGFELVRRTRDSGADDVALALVLGPVAGVAWLAETNALPTLTLALLGAIVAVEYAANKARDRFVRRRIGRLVPGLAWRRRLRRVGAAIVGVVAASAVLLALLASGRFDAGAAGREMTWGMPLAFAVAGTAGCVAIGLRMRRLWLYGALFGLAFGLLPGSRTALGGGLAILATIVMLVGGAVRMQRFSRRYAPEVPPPRPAETEPSVGPALSDAAAAEAIVGCLRSVAAGDMVFLHRATDLTWDRLIPELERLEQDGVVSTWPFAHSRERDPMYSWQRTPDSSR